MQGDMSDAGSMLRATHTMDAVYISVHTLAPQPGSKGVGDFMEVEMQGLENIVKACRANGVHRVIYVTFLGAVADSPSAWVRGRWQCEQYLLKSDLDVTVIRPGMIVGIGGQGFNMTLANAKRRVAIMIGNGQNKFRTIAIDDLAYYLAGVLNDARAYGQCYDVGSDDLLTGSQLIDTVADVLGRSHPAKFHIPLGLLKVAAPLIERMAGSPKGAIKGALDGLGNDMGGNPTAIRKILPRKPLTFSQSVQRVLEQ
jgi:uncharacterized protein YbjT (DUF2867 family)